MTNLTSFPDFVFESSWEVCNKVGGIYTVLSTRAKTLQDKMLDCLFFIGPDIRSEFQNDIFLEDVSLHKEWKDAVKKMYGLNIRVGRWQVPGEPIAILVDFKPLFEVKNEIYAEAWDDFGVDSLHGYGDYDEASMFSEAAGRVAEAIIRGCLGDGKKVIYQAHEWMTGLGMMNLKKRLPSVATIFTTHATSIGRSIAGNNKLLYKYFSGYQGDQMARELSMESKHSVEKQAAWHADCFTTVSQFTNAECAQLLDKPADVVLPNGFESDFVPKGVSYTAQRRKARRKILDVVTALTSKKMPADTLIVATSGRNDYRCKGFDVYFEAMAELNSVLKQRMGDVKDVVAMIAVPCWVKGARADLNERLNSKAVSQSPLPDPFISHELYNFSDDRIVNTIKSLNLAGSVGDKVHVLLVPCYLDGHDGVFGIDYYSMLPACDLCVYPSYYEPWGYTPLESCAFRIPCVTTDLSGFGQWVNEVVGHEGKLSDGVSVLHRDDDNYFAASAAIRSEVETFMSLEDKAKSRYKAAAAGIAEKAQWKHFIKYYYEAYSFALDKTNKQQIHNL